MVKYIALFETDPEADGIGVVFPDIPGCVSAGKDYDEAYRNAHEILSYFLEEMKANGEKIPEPRTLEQIKKEWEDWKEWEKDGHFFVGQVTLLPVTKPKKYTLYLSQNLMNRIDAVCKNRSAFFTEAAERMLNS
jgi:predicted RNase H-like HicB family nuclease